MIVGGGEGGWILCSKLADRAGVCGFVTDVEGVDYMFQGLVDFDFVVV